MSTSENGLKVNANRESVQAKDPMDAFKRKTLCSHLIKDQLQMGLSAAFFDKFEKDREEFLQLEKCIFEDPDYLSKQTGMVNANRESVQAKDPMDALTRRPCFSNLTKDEKDAFKRKTLCSHLIKDQRQMESAAAFFDEFEKDQEEFLQLEKCIFEDPDYLSKQTGMLGFYWKKAKEAEERNKRNKITEEEDERADNEYLRMIRKARLSSVNEAGNLKKMKI